MDFKEMYQTVYRLLLMQVAEVVFVKSNGELRTMLCTRNIQLAHLFGFDIPYMSANLSSHDKRCSIKNNNIAVIDLVLGEGRSFNIERLVSIHFFKSVDSTEQASKIRKDFVEFAQAYKKCHETGINIDELSNADGSQSSSGSLVSTTFGLAVITPFGVYPKSAEQEVIANGREV